MFDFPPGFMGEISKIIYKSSPRPVKEISTIAALGFFAGLCGKTYQYNGSCLNLYLTLIAKSGVGKESMHSGIDLLTDKISSSNPAINDFFYHNDFSSGSELSKALKNKQSILNISGEWGQKLNNLNDKSLSSLRTEMTNVFQKPSIAFSMIGESTPATFYNALTPEMMENGFLSRFLVIEYKGDRPPNNASIDNTINKDTLIHLQDIVTQTQRYLYNYQHVNVTFDNESYSKLCAFDKKCDKLINENENEHIRQAWNRAHLKVIKVSCLLAVANSPNKPTVTINEYKWAYTLVMTDIDNILNHIQAGLVNIGNEGDQVRKDRIKNIIADYFSKKDSFSNGKYKKMKNDNVIPAHYIFTRVKQIVIFSKSKIGATQSFRNSVSDLLEENFMTEVPKKESLKKYSTFNSDGEKVTQGRVFKIAINP